MTKSVKILWRIFGILLAFGVSIGLLFLISVSHAPQKYIHNIFLSTLATISEVLYVFGLPVFLSCIFTPRPKKLSALISISIIGGLLLSILIDEIIVTFGSIDHLLSELGFIYLAACAGPMIGYIISYYTFQKRGWGKPLKIEPGEQNEAEGTEKSALY